MRKKYQTARSPKYRFFLKILQNFQFITNFDIHLNKKKNPELITPKAPARSMFRSPETATGKRQNSKACAALQEEKGKTINNNPRTH